MILFTRLIPHYILDQFSAITSRTITHNAYPYTSDLLALERRCLSTRPPPLPDIPNFSRIVTPLVLHAWERALKHHPDSQFRDYLTNGLRHGFRVGFNHALVLRSAQANMPLLNPSPVQEYLAKECTANRVLGPMPPTAASSTHVNRFGVIPKRRQPGKWRLILGLSFPPGRSVNDGIPPELSELQFTTVDKAAQLIICLGRGALLAKIDISHAYRNVPVHPDDRRLLWTVWNGSVFVDTSLPFGLRSAPKIFCAILDALEWVLCREGVSICLYHIDDLTQCAQNLQLLQLSCHVAASQAKIGRERESRDPQVTLSSWQITEASSGQLCQDNAAVAPALPAKPGTRCGGNLWVHKCYEVNHSSVSCLDTPQRGARAAHVNSA